jgi:hypothetical protein
MALSEDVNEPEGEPVLHVLVVGFHHKRGCQVEYAYPPLIPGKVEFSSLRQEYEIKSIKLIKILYC